MAIIMMVVVTVGVLYSQVLGLNLKPKSDPSALCCIFPAPFLCTLVPHCSSLSGPGSSSRLFNSPPIPVPTLGNLATFSPAWWEKLGCVNLVPGSYISWHTTLAQNLVQHPPTQGKLQSIMSAKGIVLGTRSLCHHFNEITYFMICTHLQCYRSQTSFSEVIPHSAIPLQAAEKQIAMPHTS